MSGAGLGTEQQKSFTYLVEVETLGQDILTLKDQKLEIANAQNKFREALQALKSVEDRKTWIKVGSVYIERSTEDCRHILKDEIAKAEEDIKELRDKIKDKVHKLRDIEHEPRLEGFFLKPVSVSEVKALHKSFGLN